jgi:hypothetical protein
MASPHQVRYINKSDRFNPHERILNIGGKNGYSSRWKLSQQAAINGIENPLFLRSCPFSGLN